MILIMLRGCCLHISCGSNISYLFFSPCTVPPPNRPTTPLGTAAIVPPPRPLSRPKLPTGKLTGINEAVSKEDISGFPLKEGWMWWIIDHLVVFCRAGRSALLKCPTPALLPLLLWLVPRAPLLSAPTPPWAPTTHLLSVSLQSHILMWTQAAQTKSFFTSSTFTSHLLHIIYHLLHLLKQ